MRGTEYNRSGGIHYHALLSGVGDLFRSDSWSTWFHTYGMARIEPYDECRGAGYYLCKYVVKGMGELAFSDNLKGGK